MAAAIRALRRLPAASTARLLPSSLPGPFPKLHTAAAPAAASSLPSVLRRYCSASTAMGGDTATGLASMRRAYISPLQVPSPMLMRHLGCTKGAAPSGVPALRSRALFMPRRAYYSPKFNSLEQCCSDEEAVQFVVEKLQNIDKSLAQLERTLMLQAALLVLFLHLLFREVAALREKVAKLEHRGY